MAGILTPTVREFCRAYIEKTRETTSTIAIPYIEASYDPYTDFTIPSTPAPYKNPYYPLYRDYQSGYQSGYQTTPTLTPTHIGPPSPTPYTNYPYPPTLPNLLPLHLPPPTTPLSLSLERGFAPLPQCASRTGPPLPFSKILKFQFPLNFLIYFLLPLP